MPTARWPDYADSATVTTGLRVAGLRRLRSGLITAIADNKRMSRFTLRGKAKVGTQWQLYCLVHNIEKIATRAMRAG